MTGIYKRNTFTCKNVGLRISARDFSCFYVFIKDVRIQNICRGGGGGGVFEGQFCLPEEGVRGLCSVIIVCEFDN